MATNLFTVRPAVIQASAISGNRNPDSNRRRSSSSSSSSSSSNSNWWTPLFGWASEPDYIDSQQKSGNGSESQNESDQARSRFTPGCFTEEKARALRMMTKETESFHDVMYHSAIASRLASDFKN